MFSVVDGVFEVRTFALTNQSGYNRCRSDTNDELENADYIGFNTYLHCDGTATSIDQLIGYEQLLADFETYNVQVPIIVRYSSRKLDVSPWLYTYAMSLTSVFLDFGVWLPRSFISGNRWVFCAAKLFGR
jgi:hypothetical protein